MITRPNFTFFTVTCLAFFSAACNDRHRTTSPPKEKPVDIWATEEKPSRKLARMLPPGEIRAEVLVVSAPPRLNELATKLKKAAQANPGPWLKQILTAKEGEALPYDPKFGLTEGEYREFLSLSGSMVLKKAGEATLELKAEGDKIVTVKGLPGLTEVQFDTEKMTVKTPFGIVSEPTTFSADDKQKVTGPMNGFSWGTGIGSIFTGNSIKLFVAQQAESLDILMEFRIRDSTEGKYIADYMVRYPGPTK